MIITESTLSFYYVIYYLKIFNYMIKLIKKEKIFK